MTTTTRLLSSAGAHLLRRQQNLILISCSSARRCAFSAGRSAGCRVLLPRVHLPTKDPTKPIDTSTRSLASIPLTNVNDDETLSSPPPSQQQPPPPLNPRPNFDQAEAAYSIKSTTELARSMLSFSLCQVPILVKHSEGLLNVTRKILGDTITDAFLKATLFGHFCAGEDEQKIRPAIHSLGKAGIGSILDFAAEDDGSGDGSGPTILEQVASVGSSSSSNNNNDEPQEVWEEVLSEKTPKVRVYDYESEAECDGHVRTFQKCIRDVASLGQDGYAAIKVTALGNPKLLERMSRAIVEAQNLFAKFDMDNDGMVSRADFEQGVRFFFTENSAPLSEWLDEVACSETGKVDYITWSMKLSPRDLPKITASCREVGPLALAAPTEEEVELIENMFARGRTLAQEAMEVGTRLLIDAEQVRFQPAIDNQCYLKDVPERLRTDVERSELLDYHFGAKLVRGAYMESERLMAQSLGYPSPIHDTIQDTHDCYNDSVDFLLQHAAASPDNHTEIMLASHNRESIEKAIDGMNQYGVDRKDPVVSFGQLYGMSDTLTFNLGKHGYRAYKYVPYGEVKMVMPYLIRRANENSSIASGAKQELSLIRKELYKRSFGRVFS